MTSEIQRFNDDIVANPEMMEAVKALGSDVEKIVAYANENSYIFTIEELKVAANEDIELSEDDLESVSGGANGNVVRNQNSPWGVGNEPRPLVGIF
jgi:predicted ribosomally synthesized peptide with nif11-like leader